MRCLSEQQIAELVLEPGQVQDAACDDHLRHCAACRNRVTVVRALARQLAAAHARFDRDHDAARDRLLSKLAAENPAAQRKPVWNRTSTVLGAITMRQRIAVGSMGLAALVAWFVLWAAASPKSAIAEMADNIRQAKSWKATMKTRIDLLNPPDAAQQHIEMLGKFYWLAPGSVRMETDLGKGRQGTEIFPFGKPGIDIDRQKKTFARTPARQGQHARLMMLEKLGQFAGQADRELGEKVIDGRRVRGFVVDMRKIDPDGYPGDAEIWVAVDTNLPALMTYKFTDQGRPASLSFSEFEWNLELDPALFDTTPPEGFADVTRTPPSLDKQIVGITQALATYSELWGGNYPRGKMVYGDVSRDEMLSAIGVVGRATPNQVQSEEYRKIVESSFGFATLNSILRDNPDAAYHGQSVAAKDADKILLRWLLDDGRYQVIYGDLRAEILPVERLRAVERK